jgi:hypothetical protein
LFSSGEFMILRFLPKHVSSWSSSGWSKWVSYRANMAIHLFRIVWLIIAHFSVQVIFALGADAPFTFKKAMFIFAFKLVLF